MSTHTHLPSLHEYLDALEARLHRGASEGDRLGSLRVVHEDARKGLDVATEVLAATDLFEDCESEHERLRARVKELRALVEQKAAGHF
jgi:hypothetical protein